MTIIAAIDFTGGSSDGGKLAARLGGKFGDKLLLVHALGRRSRRSEARRRSPRRWTSPVIAGAEESIRLLRSPLAIEDVEVEARVVSGAPARAIEGVASETNARLIVAGSHGRGLAGRRLVGSVAQHLVLNSPCAVLVVRDVGRTSLERAARGIVRIPTGEGEDVHSRASLKRSSRTFVQGRARHSWAAQFLRSAAG